MSIDTSIGSPKPDHPIYRNGDIVWTKLGSSWWPGEVKSQDELPSDLNSDFKKAPLVIVKFFEEDSYEYVKNWAHIYPYNCDKKNDFIKKGMIAFRSKAAHMEKFPKDVTQAEVVTGGNPNILSDPVFLPPKKFNYSELFTTPSPNPKKVKSTFSFARRSTPHKNSALITHRRFLGHDDYRTIICVQYPGKFRLCEDEDGKDALNEDEGQLIECKPCGFSTKRLPVMMIHAKMHLSSTNKKRMKPARKKKDTKTKKETYTELLDEWSDEDQEDDSKENSSVIKESPKETALSEIKTPRTYSKKSKIEYLEEKSWEDSDLADFLKKDKSFAKKSPKDKSKKAAEVKETSKTAQITEEDIKNCFDFEEEDEDQDLIIATTPGRKIPRVIPEKTKSPRTEELEHTLEDDLTDISRDEILRTSRSFNKDADDKGTDNLEDIFKEVMEETSLPQVERLINNFKPEQNFHDGRTVKKPDKCGLSDSETGRLSPKKRFVKSFEDIETETSEKKDLTEEKRKKEPVETPKQPNEASKLTNKREILNKDNDSEKAEDNEVNKVIKKSKESPKSSRSTRQSKVHEKTSENKEKEVDQEISTVQQMTASKEVSILESNTVVKPTSKVESPRRTRHSDLKVLPGTPENTQTVETVSPPQSLSTKEPKSSSPKDGAKQTRELPKEELKPRRRSGRHHVEALDHSEIDETAKSDNSSISVTVADNDTSTCELISSINQSDSDIEISLKLADSSILENQELKSRRSLSKERQNTPIPESRRSARHHKLSEQRREEEKLSPDDNKTSKRVNRNTSKDLVESLPNKETESSKPEFQTEEMSNFVMATSSVNVKVPHKDEKKSKRLTRHKITEHVTAEAKALDEYGGHKTTESFNEKPTNEVDISKDERKSRRQTRLTATEHVTKEVESSSSTLEKIELEKPLQNDTVAEILTVESKSDKNIPEIEKKSPIVLEKSVERKTSRRQTRHRIAEHDTEIIETNEATLEKSDVDNLVIEDKLLHNAEPKSEIDISNVKEKKSMVLEEFSENKKFRRQTRSRATVPEVEKSSLNEQIEEKTADVCISESKSVKDISKVEEKSPIVRKEPFDNKKSRRTTRHRAIEHVTAEVDANDSIVENLAEEKSVVLDKPLQHEQTEQEANESFIAKSEIFISKLEEPTPIVVEKSIENKRSLKRQRQTRHRATEHVTAEIETLETPPNVEESSTQNLPSQNSKISISVSKREKDASDIKEKSPIVSEESIKNKKFKRQVKHKATEHVTAEVDQAVVEVNEKSPIVLEDIAEIKKSRRQTRHTPKELPLVPDKEPSPIEEAKEDRSREQIEHMSTENATIEINDKQELFNEEEIRTTLDESRKPEEKRRGRSKTKESVESAEVKSEDKYLTKKDNSKSSGHLEQSTFENSKDVLTSFVENINVSSLEESSVKTTSLQVEEKSNTESTHPVKEIALEELKLESKPCEMEKNTNVPEEPSVEKKSKDMEKSISPEKSCADLKSSLGKESKGNKLGGISAEPITKVVTVTEVEPVKVIKPNTEVTEPKTLEKKGRGRPRKSSKLESLSESTLEDQQRTSVLKLSDKDKESLVINEDSATSFLSPKKVRENEIVNKQTSEPQCQDERKDEDEKQPKSQVSKSRKHSTSTTPEKHEEEIDKRKTKHKDDLDNSSKKSTDKTPEKSKLKQTHISDTSLSKKTTDKTPEKNKSKQEHIPETHTNEAKDIRKSKDKKPRRRDSSGESRAKKSRKEEAKIETHHGLRERRARTTYSEEEKILQMVLKESAEEAKRLEAQKAKEKEQQDKPDSEKHTPDKKTKTPEKKDKKESNKDLADKREGHKPDKKDKKDSINESPEKTEGGRELRRRTTKVSEEDRILEKVLKESAEEARLLAEQNAAKELKLAETLNETQDTAAEESTSKIDNHTVLDQKMLDQEKLDTSPSKPNEPIGSIKKSERRSRWDSAMSGATPEKSKPVGIPLGVVVDTKQKSTQNKDSENEDNQLKTEITVTKQLFESVEIPITISKDVVHPPPLEEQEKIFTKIVDSSMEKLTPIVVEPAMAENKMPLSKVPEPIKEPLHANADVFLEPTLKEKLKDTSLNWAKPTRRLSEEKIFPKKMVEPKIKIKISSKLVSSIEEPKSDEAFKTLQPIASDHGSKKSNTSSVIEVPFEGTPTVSVSKSQKIKNLALPIPISEPKVEEIIQRVDTPSKIPLVGEASNAKQPVLETNAEKPKLVEPVVKEQRISEVKGSSVYDFPSSIEIPPQEESKEATHKIGISSTVFGSQSIYDFSFDVSEIPLPPGSPKKPEIKPVELISLPPLEEIPLPETPVPQPVKINKKEPESIQEEPIPPKKGRWSRINSNSKEENRFYVEESFTLQKNKKDEEEQSKKTTTTAAGNLVTEGSEIILPLKKSRRVTESSTSLIEDEFSFKEDDTSSSLQQNINDALNFLMQDTASPARKSGASNSVDVSKIVDDQTSDVIPASSTLQDVISASNTPQAVTPASNTLQDVTPASGNRQDLIPASSNLQDDVLRKTIETQKGVPPKKKKLDIPLEELEGQKMLMSAYKEEISQPPKKKLQKFYENSHVPEKSRSSDMPLMSPLAKKKSFAFQDDFFEVNQVQAESVNLKEDILASLSKNSKLEDSHDVQKTEDISLLEREIRRKSRSLSKSEEVKPKTIEIIPKSAKVELLVIEEQKVEVSQHKMESAVPRDAVTVHIEIENQKIDSLETSIKEIVPQEAKIEEIPKPQDVMCNQVTLDFETGHFTTTTTTTGIDSIKSLQETKLPKEESQNFISLMKETRSIDIKKKEMVMDAELSKSKAANKPAVSKNIGEASLFKTDESEVSKNDIEASLESFKNQPTDEASASETVNQDDLIKLAELEFNKQNVKPVETDLKKREKIVIKVSKEKKLATSDAFSAHIEQTPSSSKLDQVQDYSKDFLEKPKEVKNLVKEKILTSKILTKPKTEVLKDTSKGKLVIKVTESKSKDSIKPIVSLKPEVIKTPEDFIPKPDEENVVMGTKPDVIPDPPIEAELVEIEENLIQTISQKELADTQVTITSEHVITEKKPQGLGNLLTMADFSESSNSSIDMPETKKSTAGTEFTEKAMTKALDSKIPVSKSLTYGRLELLDILEGNSNSNSSVCSNEPSFKKMFEKALSQTVGSNQTITKSKQVVNKTEKAVETTVHAEANLSSSIFAASGSNLLAKKIPNTTALTASISGESPAKKTLVKTGVASVKSQAAGLKGPTINEAAFKKALEKPFADQAAAKPVAANQPIILNQSMSRESSSFKSIMEKPFGFNPPTTKENKETLIQKSVEKPVVTTPSAVYSKKETPKKPVGKVITNNENRKEIPAKKTEKPVLGMPVNPPIILNKTPAQETNKTEQSSAQASDGFEDFEDSIPCSAIIMAKPEAVPNLAELDTMQDSSRLFERLSQPQKVVIQSDIKVKDAPKPPQLGSIKAQPQAKLPVKPKLQGLPSTPTTKLPGVAPATTKVQSRKPIILSEQIIRPATVASPSSTSSAVSQAQASAVKRPFEDIEDVEQPFIIKKVARVEEPKIEHPPLSDQPPIIRKKIRALPKAKILQHSIIAPQRKLVKSPQPPKTFPTQLSKTQTAAKLKSPTTQGQLLLTTASSTSTSTLSQASTSQTDDAMFDINSMPIVLSDEIITPESLETMPVVLSNEAVALPGTSAVCPAKPAAVKEKIVSKMPPKKQGLFTGVGIPKTSSLPALSPTSQLLSTDIKQQPKPKTPGGAGSTLSKVPVAGGLLTTPGSKNAKFLLVSSNAANQGTPRVVGSAKQILVNKPSTTVSPPKPAQTGVVTTDPSSGSKIMIVTNQQGEAHRLLLTPTQQKMLGMQTQDEKEIKTVAKGLAFKGGILAEALAGTSSLGPLSPTLATPAQKQNNLAVAGPSSQAQASTSGLSTGRNILASASRLGKLTPAKKYQAKTGKQKTILIKNQLGETVTKIQGTDDDELDRQVAEQLAAIKATAMLQAQEAAQRSGQDPRTVAVPSGSAPTTPKTGIKPVPKRTPPKKSEYVRPKFGVPSPGSTRLLEGISSANAAPSLSPLGGTQKPPQLLKKALVEKPPAAVQQKTPATTVKDDQSMPSTHLQPQPAPAQLPNMSASQSLTAAENKKPDRPLQQLVIQDPTGNRTTITEGQILALPSETVDGQPQSYMLITLDEFGNLTPLNNEALMNLDPSLALGGDLNNMVLQVDQGQGVLAPASAVANKSDVVAPIITDQQKVAERIKDSVNEPKEHDKPETIQKPHKKAPEPAKPVQKQHHKLPSPVHTAPAPLESVQLATEQLDPHQMLPELHVSLGDPPDGDPSQGQQLMVTGDPAITQKFLESLSDGSIDLASILATDGGALLIEIDGQQILIRTNSQLEGATLMPASESSEGDGNPIFSPQHKPNQDILAAALANTDVFQQQDSPTSMMNKDGLLPPGAELSPNSAGGALYPMHVAGVLETSLTLSAPIMTPLEAPSLPNKKIADEVDILSQVPKNPGDLPITITDPNIVQTVSNPPPLVELSLPLTETTCISSQIEATCSPSFSYGLSFMESSKGGARLSKTAKAQSQNAYNGNMPLLTDDLTEESPVVTARDSVKDNITLTETTSSSTESLLDAGLCTLGGSMCSSLSEPPPDMFELPEKEEEISSDQSNSVPEAETLSLNSDTSGEIPLQPPIVAKLSDIKRLERGSDSSGESSDTFGPKRAKYD